jgi:hypothetical protein
MTLSTLETIALMRLDPKVDTAAFTEQLMKIDNDMQAMREALVFYAKKAHYFPPKKRTPAMQVLWDNGDIARKVIADLECVESVEDD